jgi:2-oxoacid:acceptor oxidoreductase delta subunit (pyruvate/2-ketoisovalerate family)
MLNRDCERESQSRLTRKIDVRIDSEYRNPLLTPQEAEYEASRCLGTISCEACDVCRMMCPDLAITRDDITGQIVIDLDYCKGCGICAFVCPKGAITMLLEENS